MPSQEILDSYYRFQRERCPFRQSKYSMYDGVDMCEESGKWCLLEHGYECEVYEEYLKEERNDTADIE